MDSLGLTTCLTGTDTVDASNFSKAGAAAAIADVDGTPASVSAAITAITNGTLDGQVPGVAQIEALATAQSAVTAHEEANAAAVDALAESLGVVYNPAADTFDAHLTAVYNEALSVRNGVSGGTATNVLEAQAVAAANVVNNNYKALTAPQKLQADTYVAAIAAEATAKAGIATAVQKAGAVASFDADTTADAALVTGGYADGAALYAAYVNGTAGARSQIDTDFAASPTYAAFKAAAVKDAAYADAIKATLSAQDTLDNVDTLADTTAAGFQVGAGGSDINGVEVTFVAGNEAVPTGTTATNTYVTNLGLKAVADSVVVDAKAADADLTAATALQDAYVAKTEAVDAAATAVGAIDVAGKVATHDLVGNTDGTGTVAAPIKDVFYFADKSVAADTATNFTIGSFAAGDAIVLGGSSYTFNSGALSTGDNNKLEFFLVKSGSDLQVVLETASYGSSDVTTNTAGAVTSVAGDHAAVITLTGVALADVTVNNGVISHVA